MSTETGAVDWAAALAEVEAEIAKLQEHADFIRARIARGGGTVPTGGPGGGGGIRPDSFLKMSIPDATKKYLETVRQKQSTQEIIDALERGGLPRSKYNTVYGILARRERQQGDIINMKGDWALQEWYPNHRPKTKGAAKDSQIGENAKEPEKKATA
jgi:hypothetical protein